MKTKLTLLFIATFSFFTQAQECVELESLMAQAASQKNAAAYQYLVQLQKDCQSSMTEAAYRYGEYAIKYEIDAKKENATEKERLTRELMKFYGDFHNAYPTSKHSQAVAMKKGLALFNYNVGSQDEIYQLLDNGFKNDLANFDSPQALYAYFEIFVNDYKAGNKGIDLQQVFDKYDDISDRLAVLQKDSSEILDAILTKEEAGQELNKTDNRNKKISEAAIENGAIVSSNMDAIIVELSTCEKLIPFYQKSFEENRTNEQWLKRASDRLEAKGCDGDPLFSKLSEALYKLNPSADAAYKLGIVETQRGNKSKALDYFNQAAGMYTDGSKKAAVYMRMASMYKSSSKSQARTYAEKALQAKPSYGIARLFIAGLYGSSINDVGGDNFEKRAIYWLAAQEADRAGAIDPSVRSRAAKMASDFRAAAPSKSEIFQNPNGNMSGKQVCFGSWIGKCITVPKL